MGRKKSPVLDNHKRVRGTAVAHRFRSKDYRNLRTGQRRQDGRCGCWALTRRGIHTEGPLLRKPRRQIRQPACRAQSFRLNGAYISFMPIKGPTVSTAEKAVLTIKSGKQTLPERTVSVLRTKARMEKKDIPGRWTVTVCYRLTEENEVEITYRAVSDKDTIINLTNHAFYNLKGHGNGSNLGP